jgi:hypothetical protein
MKDFKIPKPVEQVIPQVENFFKSVLFISLLVCSFALAQIGVILNQYIHLLSGYLFWF